MPSSRDLPTQGLKLHLLCLLHCVGQDLSSFNNSDSQGWSLAIWAPPQFGRTEVIDNTLNPDFVRKFIVDYFFEEKQNLRFDLYDVDSKSPDLSKHDFLGQAFCTLGEIVGSPGSRLEKSLTGVPGKKCGTIILSAEELSNCRDVATMQFCANKLDKKDFFGKSDPFLVFYRSNEDGTFTICHKTEVMKNTLNPVWQTFSIPVRALCNGDYDRSWDRKREPGELQSMELQKMVKNPPAKQKSLNFTITLEGVTSELGVSDRSSHGCPCTQTEEAAWLPTVPALTSLPGPGRLAASLPLQSISCSCLENPRDGAAWWTAVYGVAQSRTQLKQLSSSSSSILPNAPVTSSLPPPLAAIPGSLIAQESHSQGLGVLFSSHNNSPQRDVV
ncbi:hypothetical protein FD755_022257, partial [Muntiacus reevesi]